MIVLPFAIVWPFGGLEDASHAPPRVALGQPVTGHRLQFVIRRTIVTAKDPLATFGAGTPGRYLVLDLDITNVSKQPSSLPEAYLDVRPRLGVHELTTYAYRPVRQHIGYLDPGRLVAPSHTQPVARSAGRLISMRVVRGSGHGPRRCAFAISRAYLHNPYSQPQEIGGPGQAAGICRAFTSALVLARMSEDDDREEGIRSRL
ncbi:hypothetical protein [Nonomuraea sp. NPDC049784]|uniref:hypothetical protein n=1 Tax=Nonomuraea sp. NPDC049784 TaxID=3154361 RepID=UPI0033C3DFE7